MGRRFTQHMLQVTSKSFDSLRQVKETLTICFLGLFQEINRIPYPPDSNRLQSHTNDDLNDRFMFQLNQQNLLSTRDRKKNLNKPGRLAA